MQKINKKRQSLGNAVFQEKVFLLWGIVKNIYNVLGVFTFDIIASFIKKVCTKFIKTRKVFCELCAHFFYKRWVESIGFKYLSARTKEEYDAALQEFLSEDSDCPIFLEVFTDKEVNTELMDAAYSGEKSMKGKVFSFGLKTLGIK